MNDQERSRLTDLITNPKPFVTLAATMKWIAIWSCGLAICALVAFAMMLSLGAGIIAGLSLGPLAIAGIICLYAILTLSSSHLHWTGIHRDFVRYQIPEIQRALENGKVYVKKVIATSVVLIAEIEDEGSGYLYDVGDGKVLFLKGQQYEPVELSMSWPNSEFEIVSTVHGEIWVGIFCQGELLTPVVEIPTSDCVDDLVWDEREELLDDSLDNILKSIKKPS